MILCAFSRARCVDKFGKPVPTLVIVVVVHCDATLTLDHGHSRTIQSSYPAALSDHINDAKTRAVELTCITNTEVLATPLIPKGDLAVSAETLAL